MTTRKATGTIMGRPRPRSKATSSSLAPAEGQGKGERTWLHRNRPLTWRSALLLLVPLTMLSAAADVALYSFVSDHYARHGQHCVPLDIAAAALAFTALTVYGCVSFWREMRKSAGSMEASTPANVAAKHRATKDPP